MLLRKLEIERPRGEEEDRFGEKDPEAFFEAPRSSNPFGSPQSREDSPSTDDPFAGEGFFLTLRSRTSNPESEVAEEPFGVLDLCAPIGVLLSLLSGRIREGVPKYLCCEVEEDEAFFPTDGGGVDRRPFALDLDVEAASDLLEELLLLPVESLFDDDDCGAGDGVRPSWPSCEIALGNCSGLPVSADHMEAAAAA